MAPSVLTVKEAMEVAITKRQNLFRRAQECYDLIKKPEYKQQFLVRCQRMDNTYEKFEEVSEEIEKLNVKSGDGVTPTETLKTNMAFEQLFYEIKAHQAALQTLDELNVTSVSETISQRTVPLPTLSVPVFSGDITQFSSWKALYDELVHSSTVLSDIQKFSYLKTYLSGAALSTIESVAFSAANYPLAYKCLNERFHKKRLLASNQLNKILSFQSLTKDSLSGLRSFLDNFFIPVESLKSLNVPNLGDFILLHLALKALDPKTSLAFESENIDQNFPTFSSLISYVRNKCSILEVSAESSSHVSGTKSKNDYSSSSVKNKVTQKTLLTNVENNKSKSVSKGNNNNKNNNKSVTVPECPFCHNVGHKIFKCFKFLNLDVHQRYVAVKDLKLCFSCLHPSHSRQECKSTFQCKSCGSADHHSLLHPTQGSSSSRVENGGSTSQDQPQTALSGVVKQPQASYSVLLGTAVVNIKDRCGELQQVRCVVDPGSQVSAITEHLAQRLKLPRQRCSIQISGIGSVSALSTGGEISCDVFPHSSVHDFTSGLPLSIRAVILPKIAADLPSTIPVHVMNKFSHLQLADTTFLNKCQISTSVDLLIGAEHYGELMLSSLPAIPGSPTAIPTRFGWVLMGRVNDHPDAPTKRTSLFIHQVDPVADQLSKFWELEEVSSTPPQNPEDVKCEEHFRSTHSRDSSGRYMVRLPVRESENFDLGSNRGIAEKRYASLERKLNRNLTMKVMYDENLQTYLDSNHMEEATVPAPYLLVHHGVYKETSTTTKLRVVFDPNISSSTGKCLSDLLLVGPKLQADIGDLLIKFRLHQIALTCDIQAMYRNILLHPEDRIYQHVLWRPPGSPEVKEFTLRTVTFGLPGSPFQAQRVIQQLSEDEKHNFPRASAVASDSIYVDDIVSGGSSVQDVIALRNELNSLFESGGFTLRKWASSHPQVLADLPSDMCETTHTLGCTESIKILGIQWCPKGDSFFYQVLPCEVNVTKRLVLSKIATIYDMNGLISPVVIWLKIFMQQLWLNKDLTWDSTLPNVLQEKWQLFNKEMHMLSSLHIPRLIMPSASQTVELVGFSDASTSAMAAVVYLRVTSSTGNVSVNLIRSKTKVAPLKVQSVPRLELCAAQLLARVISSLNFLKNSLNISNIYLFSDSSTVLSWLKVQPHTLKTFVANRVTHILELTDPSQWRHVTSKNNIADPASRGLYPSELIENKQWFRGPDFLYNHPDSWPQSSVSVIDDLPEQKSVSSLISQSEPNYFIQVIEKFSSLVNLERVMAFVLRFIHNIKKLASERVKGFLSISELQAAREKCIKITQREYFREEIHKISRNLPCSSLQVLSPFIDTRGFLMVGGRLSKSPLPETSKHPILIPNKSHLATLVIQHYHLLSIHGGPKIVQSLIHRHYWIIGARALIRRVIHTCLPCFKSSVKCQQPYMADIPVSRFQQGRPFLRCGTDFAGPFNYKTGPRRNSPVDKCYFAIFICMTTKCVHLELVSSLSTPAFLAALDRFVGRRGLPNIIYSDNGTNYKGAAAYLSEVQQFLKHSEPEIVSYLVKREVRWSFIPPGAPNFGGLWEAGVKSVKQHLKHVLNQQTLNFEEFTTFLVRIEAIVNSRPLCGLSSNPDDGVDCLTPAHFLIGAPLIAVPERDIGEDSRSLSTRWQLISRATQCFWKRWRQDYIHTLIQRPKIKGPTSSRNLECGDLVVLQHPNMSSQQWPLGRVIKTIPGSDGVVRVVVVKTANGELKRPASKVAVLPFQS